MFQQGYREVGSEGSSWECVGDGKAVGWLLQ